MGVSETEEQYWRKAGSWTLILTIGVATFVAKAVEDIWNIPYFIPFGFVFWLGFLVEYWIPPKPPISFLVWFFKATIWSLGFVFSFALIPDLLANYIWKPLAYGLPVLAFFLGSYWLLPAYPNNKKATLKNLILIGLIFAVVYGTIMFFVG